LRLVADAQDDYCVASHVEEDSIDAAAFAGEQLTNLPAGKPIAFRCQGTAVRCGFERVERVEQPTVPAGGCCRRAPGQPFERRVDFAVAPVA
jgi:hypothetical protein